MDIYGRVGLSFTVTKRIEVFYMKQFEKWRSLCITGLALGLILSILLFLKKEYIYMYAGCFAVLFRLGESEPYIGRDACHFSGL